MNITIVGLLAVAMFVQCILGSGEVVALPVESEEQRVDTIPPTMPRLELSEVRRGRGNVEVGNNARAKFPDPGKGIITFFVAGAKDETTPKDRLRYRFYLVNGRSPRSLELPSRAYIAKKTRHGAIVKLYWQDGAIWDQDPFNFTATVTAVDLAGNESRASKAVRVEHHGYQYPELPPPLQVIARQVDPSSNSTAYYMRRGPYSREFDVTLRVTLHTGRSSRQWLIVDVMKGRSYEEEIIETYMLDRDEIEQVSGALNFIQPEIHWSKGHRFQLDGNTGAATIEYFGEGKFEISSGSLWYFHFTEYLDDPEPRRAGKKLIIASRRYDRDRVPPWSWTNRPLIVAAGPIDFDVSDTSILEYADRLIRTGRKRLSITCVARLARSLSINEMLSVLEKGIRFCEFGSTAYVVVPLTQIRWLHSQPYVFWIDRYLPEHKYDSASLEPERMAIIVEPFGKDSPRFRRDLRRLGHDQVRYSSTMRWYSFEADEKELRQIAELDWVRSVRQSKPMRAVPN